VSAYLRFRTYPETDGGGMFLENANVGVAGCRLPVTHLPPVGRTNDSRCARLPPVGRTTVARDSQSLECVPS